MKKFINQKFIKAISVADDHIWVEYLEQYNVEFEEVDLISQYHWDRKACREAKANTHKVLLRRTPATTVPTGYLPLI